MCVNYVKPWQCARHRGSRSEWKEVPCLHRAYIPVEERTKGHTWVSTDCLKCYKGNELGGGREKLRHLWVPGQVRSLCGGCNRLCLWWEKQKIHKWLWLHNRLMRNQCLPKDFMTLEAKGFLCIAVRLLGHREGILLTCILQQPAFLYFLFPNLGSPPSPRSSQCLCISIPCAEKVRSPNHTFKPMISTKHKTLFKIHNP